MRSLRGGDEVKLGAVPVQTYAFNYGGSESENAAKMLIAMSDRQNQINNTLSGGRGRIKRGGSNGVVTGQIEIPQFSIGGPKVSDQNANSSSLQLNSLLVQATNDATNDSKIEQSGGRRRKTRRRKNGGSKRSYKKNHKRGCNCKYHKSAKHKKSKKNKYRR